LDKLGINPEVADPISNCGIDPMKLGIDPRSGGSDPSMRGS